MTTGDRVILRITLLDVDNYPVRAGSGGLIIGGKGPMDTPQTEYHISMDEVNPETGRHRSVWSRATALRRK